MVPCQKGRRVYVYIFILKKCMGIISTSILYILCYIIKYNFPCNNHAVIVTINSLLIDTEYIEQNRLKFTKSKVTKSCSILNIDLSLRSQLSAEYYL